MANSVASQSVSLSNATEPPPYCPRYSSLPSGFETLSMSQSISLLPFISPTRSVQSSRAPSPPPFTPKSRRDELSLQFQPPSNSSSHYVYESRSMTLNLGSRIQGTSLPSYGNNANIEGELYVKDWKHIKDITLTVTGKVHTTLLENGTPVARQHPQVLNHVQSLWSSTTPTSSALHNHTSLAQHSHPKSIPFSFPIPTYAFASSSLLPPTRRAASSNLRLLVRYELFVDLHRDHCLLHRHERVGGEWRYLPKSVPDPSGSTIEGIPDEQMRPSASGKAETLPAPQPEPWKVFSLVPSSSAASAGIIAQFGLPRPLSYTSGIPIPYRVFLIPVASDSSVSAVDIHPSLSVSLVKILTFYLQSSTPGPKTIEKVLGEGVPWKIETKPGEEGIWQVDGYVNRVKAGGEMSWSLEGCITVKYILRVVYTHRGVKHFGEQLVQLVTDDLSAINIETDEEAWERPQLGLLNGSCDPTAPGNSGRSWMSRVALF